jgi:hypothetical protein
MKRCLLLLGALFVASPVFAASSQVVEKPLVAQSLDSFNTEAAKIREQMRPGGVYDHIASKDKGRVEERLDQMQKLLSAHSADGDLRREDKVALLNAQEEVNGILRHNDNNRLVCEHTAPVGSHVPKTTCRTYGEVLEQQRADQKFLQDRALYNHN